MTDTREAAAYAAGWIAGRDAAACTIDAEAAQPSSGAPYIIRILRSVLALTPPTGTDALAQIVREAVEREREACAVTASRSWMPLHIGQGYTRMHAADAAAAAIRARKETPA